MPSREKLLTIDALKDAGVLAVYLAIAVCFDVALQFLVGQDLLSRHSIPFYSITALTAIIEICHPLCLASVVIERTWHELRDRLGGSKAHDRGEQSLESGSELHKTVFQWYKRNPLHENELVWAAALLGAVMTGARVIFDQDVDAAFLCGFGSSSIFLLLRHWESRGYAVDREPARSH